MFFRDDDDSSSGANLFARLLAGLAEQQQQQQRQQQQVGSRTLLFKAAAEGNSSFCKRIVASGVDPDVRVEKQLTALHVAAYKGHDDTVKTLLDCGADADVADEDGDTPLMLAVMQKEWDSARILVEHGAELRLRNKKGVTAADLAFMQGNIGLLKLMERRQPALQFQLHGQVLSVAAREGNTDIVTFWLDRNKDRNACNEKLGDGRTLAFIAALNGHLAIVERLEESGADYNIADDEGNIPIFCAAQNGHDKILRILLRRSRVNHRNANKRTALFSAVLNGRETTMNLLLDAGAEADIADSQGLTPLACSIISDESPDRIVRLLASRTKNFEFEDKNGYGYAHLAVISKRLPVLKAMRNLGLMLDQQSKQDGETALLAACQTGPVEMVEYLLKEGCNAGQQNKKGVSPALRAAYCKQEEIVKLLAEKGAQLDLPNRLGETAILCAAQQNIFATVQLLHRRGCNIRVADSNGQTVAHYAAKNGNQQLLAYLDQNGVALDKSDAEGLTPLMVAAGSDDASTSVVRMLFDWGGRQDGKNKKGQNAAQIALAQGNRHLLPILQGGEGGGRGGESPRTAPIRKSSPPQAPPRTPTSSAEIDGNFESWNYIMEEDNKKKPIGSGGFGKVYKAITDRHQFVAVKIIKPIGVTDKEEHRRIFKLEKQAMDLLKNVYHQNIVRFLKAEEKDGKFYIFSELLSGYTIQELMVQQKKPINEEGIRKFTKQICTALSYLHGLPKPIIHRDIKASNVMLTNPGIVKLIDFGFAREIASSSQMVTQTVCGTLYFMAPEILAPNNEGSVSYTGKSDVWAVGCTVFEMATMRPPNSDIKHHFLLATAVSGRPMPNLPQSSSAEQRDFYRLCVEQQPKNRPDAARLLKHKFLDV